MSLDHHIELSCNVGSQMEEAFFRMGVQRFNRQPVSHVNVSSANRGLLCLLSNTVYFLFNDKDVLMVTSKCFALSTCCRVWPWMV